eukprot:1177105-Prorocentrum_minimum.AAC.3
MPDCQGKSTEELSCRYKRGFVAIKRNLCSYTNILGIFLNVALKLLVSRKFLLSSYRSGTVERMRSPIRAGVGVVMWRRTHGELRYPPLGPIR